MTLIYIQLGTVDKRKRVLINSKLVSDEERDVAWALTDEYCNKSNSRMRTLRHEKCFQSNYVVLVIKIDTYINRFKKKGFGFVIFMLISDV